MEEIKAISPPSVGDTAPADPSGFRELDESLVVVKSHSATEFALWWCTCATECDPCGKVRASVTMRFVWDPKGVTPQSDR